MRQLFLLVKTGLMEQLKWRELKNAKDKKKKINAILMLVTFIVLGLFIAGYGAAGAFGMVYLGMGELIPLIAVTAVGIMTLFFTILKTNGILFGYKDYEMLSALPIKTSVLVSSRFLQLYGSNLAFSLLIMLPMGLVYGIFEGMGPIFYIMWFVGLFIAPWIPTTIAVMMGALIMAASARMKHANAISALLSIAFVVGILLLSTSLTGMDNGQIAIEISEIPEMAKNSMGKAYPVSLLFYEGIVHKNYLAFLIFVLGSGLWYALFLAVISWKYKHIQSLLTAHGTRAKKQRAFNFEMKTVRRTLLLKEWKRFLNSNIYLLNMGMGVIMQLFFAGAVFFIPQQKIEAIFMTGNVPIDLISSSMEFLPFILAGISGISCTTCCSLSLERNNVELLKALPLKPEEVYKGKIGMNLMLTFPPTLLASLLIGLKFGTGFFHILLLFLIPLLYNMFTAVFGMYVNIRFPNYSWENEAAVVKQSVPSFLGMFGGMVLALAGGIFVAVIPAAYEVTGTLAAAAVALLTAGLYQAVKRSPIP